MEQPMVSKNCPVCRQSIEQLKTAGGNELNPIIVPEKTSDDDRRTDRLIKHMETLVQMKDQFIMELIK
jgi:hypothetical protein